VGWRWWGGVGGRTRVRVVWHRCGCVPLCVGAPAHTVRVWMSAGGGGGGGMWGWGAGFSQPVAPPSPLVHPWPTCTRRGCPASPAQCCPASCPARPAPRPRHASSGTSSGLRGSGQLTQPMRMKEDRGRPPVRPGAPAPAPGCAAAALGAPAGPHAASGQSGPVGGSGTPLPRRLAPGAVRRRPRAPGTQTAIAGHPCSATRLCRACCRPGRWRRRAPPWCSQTC
jgi:hypothetical protein